MTTPAFIKPDPLKLSSESLQDWLNDLSEHVPALGALFKSSDARQQQQGYYHTLREICQQPLTWRNSAARVTSNHESLERILVASGVRSKQAAIVLTGSGSSLFVAESLGLALRQDLQVLVQPVAAGLVLTHPELALPPEQDCLVVSFARSGDSPESVAVMELLQELNGRHRYLVVTCNRQGKLATQYQDDPHACVLVLDDATCDRSLVMTSSFTNMVWAGRSLAMLKSLDSYRETTERLVQLGSNFLRSHSAALAEAARADFASAIYLGSGVRFGAARESALKMVEMTAGQVPAFAETYLGIRHGPLSAILPSTLIVCFLSGDPLVRAYELDLIHELNRKNLGLRKLIVGERIPADLLLEADLALECPGLNATGDANVPVLDAMAGQVLAFFCCLKLGLKPDSPSSQGIISRVVGEFTIHRKH